MTLFVFSLENIRDQKSFLAPLAKVQQGHSHGIVHQSVPKLFVQISPLKPMNDFQPNFDPLKNMVLWTWLIFPIWHMMKSENLLL